MLFRRGLFGRRWQFDASCVNQPGAIACELHQFDRARTNIDSDRRKTATW
jgi:hypothetical protein